MGKNLKKLEINDYTYKFINLNIILIFNRI